jgi:hypothetical protein
VLAPVLLLLLLLLLARVQSVEAVVLMSPISSCLVVGEGQAAWGEPLDA